MRRDRKTRQTAVAVAVSTAFHVLVLLLVATQVAPDYQLPESVAPPEDVQIVEAPEPPPPPVVIKLPPPKPEPVKPPPKPTPVPTPKPAVTPAPPAPQVAPPTPKPAPPVPTPTPPKVAPLPTPVAKPAVAVAPKPTPKPAIVQAPTQPAAPAPPAPKTPPAPPAPPAPVIKLNIHKPDKDAPGNVPTLPFAPAPTAGGRSTSAQAPANGEPDLGGSRLSGLSPYPPGSMPGGGGGLRGTLIGCANAEAVNLSPAERARCNERFGSEVGSAPAFDSMSPTKRAAFDSAAAKEEANRKYRAGVPPGTTQGVHGFGGLGQDQPNSLRNLLGGDPK